MHKSTATSQGILHGQSGFTLIELMIAMIIGILLATQAVPAFGVFIKNNRLVTETNKLIADLNLARSEAIKRGNSVVLCRSTNPGSSNPTCGGSQYTWSTGWLVFASGDGNTTYESANDTLIRIGLGDYAGSIDVLSNDTADDSLVFTATGLTTNDTTATFLICDDRGTSFGRQVEVNSLGRTSLTKGTASSPLASCS